MMRYCVWSGGIKKDESGPYILYTDAVKMQREAFVAGVDWDWPLRMAGVAEAEAIRRYKEE